LLAFLISLYKNTFFNLYREEEKAKEKELLRKFLEDRTVDNDDDDEVEKRVQFKATPVPIHVKEPLFERMLQEHPLRYNTKIKSLKKWF
jgi:hypothetical protein